MKRFLSFSAGFAFLFLFSCNNEKDKKAEEATAPETTAPTTISTPTTMAAASFKVIMIKHKVKNFAAWKPVYMAHDSMRAANGITHFQVARSLDDSNTVIVINKIADVKKAKDFAASADLKKAMQKAGVSGAPSVSFSEVVRNDDSKIEQKDRVMIAHKVKDFDAWLKVYDAEGMKTRMEHGVIDRGLARDADDPNMIYIVFAVTDMAKAKARIGSEELKKIMTDAGVEGIPQVTFYRLAD
jgi:quinol monooxygenase YgiN